MRLVAFRKFFVRLVIFLALLPVLAGLLYSIANIDIITFARRACSPVAPALLSSNQMCESVVNGYLSLEHAYAFVFEGISHFFNIQRGRVDEGFATLFGAAAVLFAAYVGLARPENQRRIEEKEEAMAIIDMLAEEICSIAGFAKHISGNIDSITDRKKFLAVLARKPLVEPKAFDAYLPRIFLVTRQAKDEKLIHAILSWYAYAGQVRSQQQQLTLNQHNIVQGEATDSDEDIRSLKDRFKNLCSEEGLAALNTAFAQFDKKIRPKLLNDSGGK